MRETDIENMSLEEIVNLPNFHLLKWFERDNIINHFKKYLAVEFKCESRDSDGRWITPFNNSYSANQTYVVFKLMPNHNHEKI